MSKVVAFPGTEVPDGDGEFVVGVELEDDVDHVVECLKAFQEDREELDIVAVVGVGHDGQLRWGSSTHNILEILWMCEALKRVMMDRSLGIISDEFDE